MAGCGCDDIGCDSGTKLMPIEDALKLLLENAKPISETEKVTLIEAQGRILAEDLFSTVDVPEKSGKVPGTNKTYTKAAHTAPKFKIGKTLKDAVAAGK